MSKLTAVLALWCMAGCATVASGSYGVPVDEQPKPGADPAPPAVPSGLKISAGELPDLASPYFGAVEVTFENPSPGWVQIDTVEVDFGTPLRNQAVFVPWGAYIDAWRQSIVELLDIKLAAGQGPLFTSLRLPFLAVGGDEMAAREHTAGAAGARGGVVPVASLGTAGGGAPAAAVPGQDTPSFPPSHLLSVPIRVPPGLFAKRWILFYTSDSPPGGCIQSMVLGYTTSDGKRERIAVTFKASMSPWQYPVCHPAGAVPKSY